MQTQQTTPLAPYGSMNHLGLVAKVGVPKISLSANRTVVRRVKAQ
jgi:hypothetical protein